MKEGRKEPKEERPDWEESLDDRYVEREAGREHEYGYRDDRLPK